MFLRQSSLKQFANCPRQWYYEHIERYGAQQTGSLTVLGTVWHFAIEIYENYGHDLDLALRTFNHYWDHPDLLGEQIDFYHRGGTHESLRKRGITMVTRYHELRPWAEGRLIGTELSFEVPLGDHVLHGTIDKLWVRNGLKALEVIDFKTGGYVPERLKYNIQFTAYTYATTRPEFWERVPGFEDGYERFKDYKRGGYWFHARNTKMFNAGYRTEQDYRRLLLQANEMERSVEAQIFPLDYSGETCGFCQFTEICGLEAPDPRLIRIGEK